MIGILLAALARPLPYTGTNLSAAEFGSLKPGTRMVYNRDYGYPTAEEAAYFAKRGMNVFRIPFRWENLQPEAKGEFDKDEITRLKEIVGAVTKLKAVAILDPHNYAAYYGKNIGAPEVPNGVFADLWTKLATTFKGDNRVWFGLMNEPHDLPTPQWLGSANAAVAAIRKTGAKNLILVPGNGWTGAHSWVASGNDLMLKIKDPLNRYVFEVHQYLDRDSSGSHREVVGPTVGSERLRSFVEWCRKHKKRAFLGEFGVAEDDEPRRALDDMLTSMERDRDVWLGFAWWSAGPWWGDYMFSIEPKNGKDRPQFETLRPHLQP